MERLHAIWWKNRQKLQTMHDDFTMRRIVSTVYELEAFLDRHFCRDAFWNEVRHPNKCLII